MSTSPASIADALAGLYDPYTQEMASKDAVAADRGSGPRRLTLSKADPGVYVVRILPAKPGRKSPLVIRHTHFVTVGSGNDRKTSAVPCAQALYNKPCDFCARVHQLHEAQTTLAGGVANQCKEIAKNLEAQFSFVAAALDLTIPFDPENPGDSIVIFEAKRGVYNDLLGIRNAPRGGGDYSHPVTGFGIQITKKGSGMQTEYTVVVDSESGKGPMIRFPGSNEPDVEAIKTVLTMAPDPWLEVRTPDEEAYQTALARLDALTLPFLGGVYTAPVGGGYTAQGSLGVPVAPPRGR